jgi:ribosomal 50S subunit-associated protein YjgA (DUF615 family)
MDDPIVEQVHQARQRILAECDGNVDRLIARLKAADSMNKDRLVTVEDVERRSRKPKAAP